MVLAAPVAAKSADSFVQSVGVHNVPKLDGTKLNLLLQSGIRVVRGNPEVQADFDQTTTLSNAGIKSILAIQPGTSVRPDSSFWGQPNSLNNNQPWNIVDYVKRVGVSNVVAVEMNNELDQGVGRNFKWRPTDTQNINDDPNSSLYWARYARAATEATANALNSDPATQNIPLLGPSLTSENAYSAVGDLGSWIDYSNIHHYMGGRHPETGGWGDNGYGSIGWTINSLSARQKASHPGAVAATEGGNATANFNTTNNQWSLTAHGKYVPRFYLSHFNAGYKWTCVYRFEDFNSGSSDSEENYGLIKSDGTTKPAYHALKNLLGLLSDSGPAFTPSSLDYTLSGNLNDVQTTLLQKRDGTFFLAIWLGKESWSWRETDGAGNVTKTPGEINVAPQSVNVALPASIASAQLHTLNDGGAMTSAALPMGNGSISVSVTDRVSVIQLSQLALREPENPANLLYGLDYKYYEGLWSQLPNFDALTPVKTGAIANCNLSPRNRDEEFGFSYFGYIDAPVDGLYTFFTASDDGSKLFIGNTQVVDNDGLHAVVERQGSIGLRAGKHRFKVVFFERNGGENLEVRWVGPGISKELIPNGRFRRPASDTLQNGLVGWWKMDESSGTTAADSSGNAKNGTASGTSWNPSSGRIGGAVSFSGSSAKITLPDDTIRGVGTPQTLACWFKTSSTGVILGIQNTAHPTTPGNWAPVLYVDIDGRLRSQLYNGGSFTIATTNAVNNGAWHHAALVVQNSTQSLYLNGALVGTLNGNIQFEASNKNQFGVGFTQSWPRGNGSWMNYAGSLDDVRQYNRALSAAEVAILAAG